MPEPAREPARTSTDTLPETAQKALIRTLIEHGLAEEQRGHGCASAEEIVEVLGPVLMRLCGAPAGGPCGGDAGPRLREDVTPSGVAALRMAADSMPLAWPGGPWEGAADWVRRRAEAIARNVP